MNSSGIRIRRRSGWPVERDAVHVEDLALHPVGPRPERDDRGEGRVGVVDARLDDEPLATCRGSAGRSGPRTAAAVRPGIAEVVGRPQLGEHANPHRSFRTRRARRAAAAGGTKSRRLSRNRDVAKTPSPKTRGQGRQGRGVGVGRRCRSRCSSRSRSPRRSTAVDGRPTFTWSRRRRAGPGRRGGGSRSGPRRRARRPGRSPAGAIRFSASICSRSASSGRPVPDERAALLDLGLEVHQRPEDLLGPGRAAGDVDVDRDEPVDPLDDGVGVEDPAGARRRRPC